MKRQSILLALALAAGSFAGGSGCYGSAQVTATAPAPRLVWVSDGIWVVENWPHAVYYYDGFYWRIVDGVWYRSTWYDGGFVRVSIWPRAIVRVHRPGRYVRYRAPRDARVRRIDRSHERARHDRDSRHRRR